MEKDDPKKQVNGYAKYSSLVIQMAAIIGGSIWLGSFLDKKYNQGGHLWTVCLSLFGVAAALTYVLREVINMTKDK